MPWVYDFMLGRLRKLDTTGADAGSDVNPSITVTDSTYTLVVADVGVQPIIVQSTCAVTIPAITDWAGWRPLVICDGSGITVSFVIEPGDTYNGVTSIDSLTLRNYAYQFTGVAATRATKQLLEP